MKDENYKMEKNINYEIIHLPKEQWKGTIIPIEYTTNRYYDVSVNNTNDGYTINISKKDFLEPITHYPAEYDFPDKLYEDYWEHAFAWGVIDNGKLVAAIETDQEIWSNRLRITELWVDKDYQKKGIGHSLIEVAKEQARHERRRVIILETQSCNVNAADFYMHEGFTLIGMDTCCYKNNDLDRKEVRLEFAWFPKRKLRVSSDDIIIREETEDDYYETELMTMRAFWNKYHLGCDEHYLVHKLRKCKDYLPKLSRVAVMDGKIIGCIMYSKAKVVDGEKIHDIVTFGPLCVDPNWQGAGVGEILLKETMKIASDMGYKGIVIFGEPDYYPRVGFKTCDNFNITTHDGKNSNAFMGIELIKDGLKDIKGKFYESDVFDNLPKDEVEEYNKNFPIIKKQKFPTQWD